jgi:hypothetical protein
MPLNMFTGTLYVDHGESYLVQKTQTGTTVQTPMMLLDFPSTGADPAQLIAQATAYFVSQKQLHNGSPLTVQGLVVCMGSVPFIEVVREL